MKIPEYMSYPTNNLYHDLTQYEVILPNGSYTSGTYTIPSGRTWNDFLFVVAQTYHPPGDSYEHSCTAFAPVEVFLDGDQVITSGQIKSTFAAVTVIEYVSDTSFSISTTGSISTKVPVRLIVGYLK